MEFLFEYGYFLLKTITIIVLVFIPIFILISSMRHQEDLYEIFKTKNLTKRYQSMANSIKTLSLSKDEKKKLKKSLKKEKKASSKSKKKPVYVQKIEGDIDASNVAN